MSSGNFKPWTRWWWFADAIKHSDITMQLEWLRDNGFGGAEIAWLGRMDGCEGTPAPFMSEQWAADAAFAASEAKRLGLGLDFTFGSQWPFGGEWVEETDAVETWNGPSRYRLRDPWPGPRGEKGRVINHLKSEALEHYAAPLMAALKPALEASGGALFCDSWEVPSNPPFWVEGFDVRFQREFGYDIKHLMNYLEYHAHARHDYRRLLSRYIVEDFYAAYTEICQRNGTRSRVQCHGAPADLLAAYAAVDIPETETLLFDPHFSSFAASAATLRDKPRVSCESFTALYGLSRTGPPGHEKEQIADIKLIADAMFANGVNWVIWHGMPYQGAGERKRFGATCHVGPDAPFADRLPEFNRYMETVSQTLTEGSAYTDVACYLPLEDQWMQHLMPEDIMRPSAHYHWELQYVRFPEALRGYQPCWVSEPFLREAVVEDGRIRIGAADFACLHVEVKWMTLESLAELVRLAEAGASIVTKAAFREPGYLRHDDAYAALLAHLQARAGGLNSLPEPLLRGEDLPEFRARETQEGLNLFVAHPKTREVVYPLSYGQSYCETSTSLALELSVFGHTIPLNLEFAPYQSRLLKVARDGRVESLDIEFVPETPQRSAAYPKDHRYPGYSLDTVDLPV